MMIQGTRLSPSGRRILTILAMLVLLMVTAAGGRSVLAAQPNEKTKRRVIPVTISKGQSYTISGLKADTNANSKVVNNPNALVMQKAPGTIALVGADSGSWKINVTLATGEKVTYLVTVKALTPPQGTLNPASAPTPIP